MQTERSPLRLILMRHAKSDWSHEDLSDHDRPLNDRGKRDAPRVADWLAENRLVPDLILCSSAARTQETCALMLNRLESASKVFVSKRLYLAAPQTIFSVIAEDAIMPDKESAPATVLVLAHNPGVSEAAGWLMGQMVAMPTAALVAFHFQGDRWHDSVCPEMTEHLATMTPKALGGDGRRS